MGLLEIKNLSFSYGKQPEQVLKNLNFTVNSGDFLLIGGESGSGKSTLLRLLKRELAPFGCRTGEILFNGKELGEMDDYASASKIGFVMQNPESQIVSDKVWSELAFGLENLGVPPQTIRSRVGEMASYFGIHDWFRKNTADLSGGQKQLLNLASVIVMQPDVLILDEPTAQLDPIAASEFISTLQQLNQEMNITIIIVEHRLEELYAMSTKVMLLEEGEIFLSDSPREVGRKILDSPKSHPMLEGLPASIRIYQALNLEVPAPITVKEGIHFLSENFSGESTFELSRNSQNYETQPVIAELRDVWFRYEQNGKDILRDVNLRIHQGEFFCLLGGNGSGKSTLLNVLSGIRKAYEGKVSLFGKKLSRYKPSEIYGRKLAVLPQNPLSLFIDETVRDDYDSLCQSVGFSSDETLEKIKEVSDLLGISALLDKHPYDVSGGEQQKIALGKILILDPEIILLDEPTKGIDAHGKNNFGKLLEKLQKKGKTIIMVTHDTEFAATHATRCAMFFDQQIIAMNDPVTFFSQNFFYTTPAKKIAGNLYPGAITPETVIKFCKSDRMYADES